MFLHDGYAICFTANSRVNVQTNTILLLQCYLDGGTFIIPVVISPWESLNTQISGKKISVEVKFTGILKRLIMLLILIAATGAVILFGQQRGIESDMPIWYAVGMLVFMGPTILAMAELWELHGTCWLSEIWRSILGRPNPIDPKRLGFVGRLFNCVVVFPTHHAIRSSEWSWLPFST